MQAFSWPNLVTWSKGSGVLAGLQAKALFSVSRWGIATRSNRAHETPFVYFVVAGSSRKARFAAAVFAGVLGGLPKT
jgi:hypothetical protein